MSYYELRSEVSKWYDDVCVCVNVLMYDNYTVSYNTVILYMIQERGEVSDRSYS